MLAKISLFLIFLQANVAAQNKTITNIHVEQVTPGEAILPGIVDQQILRISFDVTSGAGTLVFKSLKISSLCTSSSDISQVNLFSTIGSTFTDPLKISTNSPSFFNDTLRLNSDEVLDIGTYYYWVTMNVKSTASLTNMVDAKIEANSMALYSTSDGWVLFPSSEMSPANSRSIKQLYYIENFEKKLPSSSIPEGWESKVVSKPSGANDKHWLVINGGYSSTPGVENSGSPPKSKSGMGNAYFQVSGTNYITKLITKKLNLQSASNPVLKFWQAQTTWPPSSYDRLKVYYRNSAANPWILIPGASYDDPAETWIERNIQLDPATLSNDYYLAFEGISNFGFGTCIDSMVIHETAIANRELSQVVVNKPTNGYVPQGSSKNTAMRIDFYVKGNTNDLFLDSLRIRSLGKNDGDIKSNGVKLYHTLDSIINYNTPIGTSTSVAGKNIKCSGLNFKLPSGYSAVWVVVDIADNAIPKDTIDFKIEAQSISVGGTKYPAVEQYPGGIFIVKQSIFGDGFETNKGWTLNGEFERGQPQAKGGLSHGYPDPSAAYGDSYVIGTDLSNNGDYPANLTGTANYYRAVSPLINCKNYKNIKLQFQKYLNAEYSDSCLVEYKVGTSPWRLIWRPASISVDDRWKLLSFNLQDSLDRKKDVQFRFTLGPTDGLNSMSGWNIDEFFLTGDSIAFDGGITQCSSLKSSCGLSNAETVTVTVKNYGPQDLNSANTKVKYSLDNGITWVTENLSTTIASEASEDYTFIQKANLSKPGYYNIRTKTEVKFDGEKKNDSITFSLISYPTLTPPYFNNLQTDTSFWVPGGIKSSWVQTINPQLGSVVFKTHFTEEANQSTYHKNENSYLESPCFNLSGIAKPVFEFDFVDSTETGKDGALLYYSDDGGTSWVYYPQKTHLYPWSWYNRQIESAANAYGFTGNSRGVVKARNFLPNGLIGKPNVKLRLVFRSDNTNFAQTAITFDGFSIDNIKLYEAPADLEIVSVDNLNKPGDKYCQFEHDGKLLVTLKNVTERPLTSADSVIIGVKVNNILVVTDTFKLISDIAVDATKQFLLKKKINITTPDIYDIKVFVKEKSPNFYGTYNDTISEEIEIVSNPLTSLPDTIFTARIDTLTISTISNPDYNYSWVHNSNTISATYTVSASPPDGGKGNYYLTVSSTSTGCITKDTVFVKGLIPDIGVQSILSPTNNCGYKLPVHPVIRIKNFGTDTMRINQTIPIKIKLNKGTVLSETITLNKKFAPDSIFTATLTSTLNLMQAKMDTIKIWTELASDDSIKNDTTATIFQIYGYPKVFLGNDTVISGKLTHELNGGAGFTSWAWSDGLTTTQKLTITKPGNYSVTVTDGNNCANSDTIHVHMIIHDVTMQKIISPINACTQTVNTSVRCQIKNTGTDSIQITEPIILYYQVNSGAIQQETIYPSTMLKPNDSLQYTFNQKIDMSAVGVYSFKLKSIVVNDIQVKNDSILQNVEVYGNPNIDLGPDKLVQALNYTLYPGKFSQYLWQDNSTDTSWTISKTKFDTNSQYQVTVTDNHGCTDSDDVAIILLVNDLEVTDVIMSRNSCLMSDKELVNLKITNVGNATLTNKTVEVSYSLNGATVVKESLTFNGAVGSSAIHTFVLPVNMSAKGIYSFKTALKMAADVQPVNDTATFVTNIAGYPKVDFGAPNDTFLVKFPYTLHAGPGYPEYVWQDNSTDSIFTITQANYQPANTIYTVTVTNAMGCADRDTVNVIEAWNDLAINGISIPATNCSLPAAKKLGVLIKNNSTVKLQNQNISLKFSINGGTEVTKLATISLSKGAVQTIDFDEDVNLSSVGSYSINVSLTYLDDENTLNNTGVYDVIVYGKPVIDFGDSNDTIKTSTLPYSLDAGAGYKSYLWQDNSTDRYLNASSEGYYIVSVTSNDNCSAKDSVFVRLETGTGSLKDIAQIRVYPNPAVNYLHVNINMVVKQDLIIDVIGQDGKVIFMKKLSNMDVYNEDIDVSGFPKGLYYVRILAKESMLSQKIVVK